MVVGSDGAGYRGFSRGRVSIPTILSPKTQGQPPVQVVGRTDQGPKYVVVSPGVPLLSNIFIANVSLPWFHQTSRKCTPYALKR